MLKKTLIAVIFALAVFCLSFSVWASPILFKGPIHQGSEGIILARNLAQTGSYAIENELNVLLSPHLVKEEGQLYVSGNKLTPLLYAKIFKMAGNLTESQLTFLALTLHSLALMFFALLILYLFGFKASLIFSLIYILFPFNWQLTNALTGYEFALLFFSLFFLLYFLGLNQKYAYLYLAPAGLFLALACLAKEALLVFLPFFFFYLWRKNPKRYLIYVFLPFLILFGLIWTPNAYLLLLTEQTPKEIKATDFGRYGHFFPDPYTYHFQKEEFLENYQKQLTDPQTSPLVKANLLKTASNLGLDTPSIPERLKIGVILLLGHLARFLSLEEIGGPFIFLLMLLGAYILKKKNKYLFGFSLGWIFSALFLFSFVVLVSRRHLMDFNWILALLTALGIAGVVKIIGQYFNQEKSAILFSVLLLAVCYHLVLVNHVTWNRIYDSNWETSLKMQAYSREINKFEIADQEVIAVPDDVDRFRLNYLNGKSLVVFRKETLKNLLNKDQLSPAFEMFGVKYILGYSPNLSKEVEARTGVTAIADNSIKIPQIETTPAKVWFLNLVK